MVVADDAAADAGESAVVFERLFGDGASPEERLRDRQRNASILDAVVGQLGAFKTSLGAGDKARIDTYVDNIRELERRIKIAMENAVKEPEATCRSAAAASTSTSG